MIEFASIDELVFVDSMGQKVKIKNGNNYNNNK